MVDFRIASYEAASDMAPHCHEKSHFTVVLHGSYDELIGSRRTEHRPGSMLFYPAERPHSQRFGDEGARCINFAPPESCFDLLSEQGLDLNQASHLPTGSVSHIAYRFLAESRHGDAYSGLILNGLLLELVAVFGRIGVSEKLSKPPLWLKQVHELLEKEPDKHTTNEALAAQVGKHPVHLAKAFRRQFGETIGECQRRLRLRKAEQLLRSKHVSLVEIAMECGFSSHAHFSRSFRCAFGMTPSQFRSEKL